jgi:hypothetical protein
MPLSAYCVTVGESNNCATVSTSGTPGVYNLYVNQYATYTAVFTMVSNPCCGTVGSSASPIDLTLYTAALQIRPFAGSTTLFYDAGAAGDITLGGTAGTITLVIDATDTGNFTWFQGVYDLILTDSLGVSTRVLQGSVIVSPGVTT